MKDIKELTLKEIKKIKLIVLDVDGVLVPRGTKISQKGNWTEFETKVIDKKQIEQIKTLCDLGFKINISSGRALYMLQEMFRDVLQFVSLTYENGSSTWIEGINLQHANGFIHNQGVIQKLKKLVENDERVKGFEPKEHTITIHCTRRVPAIEKMIDKEYGLTTVWNGEAYDILDEKEQNKGEGLKCAARLLHTGPKGVLAIGDNLNDKELLDTAGISISADKSRVEADYFIPIDKEKLPADILMEHIINLMTK